MFLMVSGGSGSGKSAYAENRVLEFGEAKRIYIATMIAYGEEGKKRVLRHRKLRSGKGFLTVECPLDLKNLDLNEALANADTGKERLHIHDQSKKTVLLECMSNLTANEMFDPQGAGDRAFDEIKTGIDRLLVQCDNLVVVTNEVFTDGEDYTPEMQTYMKLLGDINCMMAQKADEVVEVVAGIAIAAK